MIRISTHTLRQVTARSSSTAIRQQAAACTHLPNSMNTSQNYFSTETVLEPTPVSFKEMDDRMRESRKNSNKEYISKEEMAERDRVMEASRRGQMEAPPQHKPIPTTTSPGEADKGKWSTADIHSHEDGGGGVYQPGLKTTKDRDDILRESKGYLQNNDYVRPPAKAKPGNNASSSPSSSSVEKGTNWPQSAFDQKMQEKRDKDREDLIAKASTLVETAKDKATPKLTDESKEILKEAAKSAKAKGKQFVEHPIDTMGSQMESAKVTGEKLFVDTKEKTKETAKDLKEATDALKQSMADSKASTLVETAKDKATPKLTDESKEILKETVKSTKAKGKQFAEHPIDTMGSQVESAKDTGEKLFVDAKEKTKETAEDLKEATDALKHSMPNSTESLRESAEEKGKQAMTKAEAKGQEVASTMKEKSEKMAGNVQDKAKEKVAETKEKGKDMLGQAQENAKQAASKTKDKAMDTASSMWNKAKQMVSGGGGK